jgi:hypothetical protein
MVFLRTYQLLITLKRVQYIFQPRPINRRNAGRVIIVSLIPSRHKMVESHSFVIFQIHNHLTPCRIA